MLYCCMCLLDLWLELDTLVAVVTLHEVFNQAETALDSLHEVR